MALKIRNNQSKFREFDSEIESEKFYLEKFRFPIMYICNIALHWEAYSKV